MDEFTSCKPLEQHRMLGGNYSAEYNPDLTSVSIKCLYKMATSPQGNRYLLLDTANTRVHPGASNPCHEPAYDIITSNCHLKKNCHFQYADSEELSMQKQS